ncbi:hypothetical protein PV326_007436 [Microctonus aethiopoides]|nr:hypothetical protein PV326_007436 [Microctonus aethiopoides]
MVERLVSIIFDSHGISSRHDAKGLSWWISAGNDVHSIVAKATDYNRHLEQLIEETENILIDILRTRLNKDSLQQVIQLHKQLENVQNLSDDGNTTTTMAVETRIFLRQTEELFKLISAMKTMECSLSADLTVIENKLENLSELVKQDNCLNAGGKFEWVDSVLVKCLKDGSWLLIDQVNLCSSAVLDRLNGLLEPGGVLTIGERGVDNDGNIHTITPHKNFRLFLTMDPRYGEISRAMRNRGVEIFLLDNSDLGDINTLDLRSMMFDLGLTQNNHQDTLLNIHHEILSKGLCADKLSSIQLLHSAFLITQQISRGFPVENAFTNACIDVYIKSKYIYQSENKERIMSIIDINMKKYNIDKCIEPIIDLSAATLNIRNLQDNAKCSMIKQQGILLLALLNKFSRKNNMEDTAITTTKFLNEYFFSNNMNEIYYEDHDKNYLDVNVEKLYPYLLYLFFLKSSADDVEIRKLWLEEYINRNEIIMSEKEKLSIEKMTKEILISAKDLKSPSQPWYSHALSAKIEDDPFSRALSISMALHLICFNVIDFQVPQLKKSKKNLSIQEYSYGLYENIIMKHDTYNIPIINYFYPFVLQVNEWLSNYVKSFDRPFDSTSLITFRLGVQWFKRFYKLGTNLCIDVSNSSANFDREYVKTTLLMHYKWLRNNLIRIEWPHSHDELSQIMAKFDQQLYARYALRKRAKCVKKHLFGPPIFRNSTIALNYEQLANYGDVFNLISYCHRDFERKLIYLQVDEISQLRSEVIKLWEDVFNNSQDKIDNGTILHVEEIANHSYLQKTFDKISQRKSEEYALNANLWPLYQYIFYTFANKVHRQLNNDCAHDSNDFIIDRNIMAKFTEIPCLSPKLIAVMNVIMKTSSTDPHYKNLLSELFTNLVLYRGAIWQSKYLCCEAIKNILNESPSDDYHSETNDYMDIINYSNNSPILTKIFSNILISDKLTEKNNQSIISIASLHLHKVYIKQINLMNHILWRNSTSFNSKHYNYTLNDREALLSYIRPYLSAMSRAITSEALKVVGFNKPIQLPNDAPPDPSSEQDRAEEERINRDSVKYYRQIQNTLTFLNHCDNDNIDDIRRGLGWIYMGYHQLLLFTHLDIMDPMVKREFKINYYSEDIEDLKMFIYANNLDSRIHDDDGYLSRTDKMSVSLIDEAKEVLDTIKSEHSAIAIPDGYKCKNNKYSHFANEIADIRCNPCLTQVIDRCEFVLLNVVNYSSRPHEHWIQDMTEVIDTLNNHRESLCRLFKIWQSKHLSDYYEYVLPLLNAVCYMIHGVDIIINEAVYSIAREKTNFDLTSTAEYFLHNLVRFPTIGPNQEDILQLIDLYTSQSGREFIERNLTDKFFTAESRNQMTMMMIKNGLAELYNYINLTKQISPAVWTELNQLLVEVVLIWRKQQMEKEKAASESASLYKNKAVIHGVTLTEEEEINEQLKKLFPSSHDRDFSDICDEPSLNAKKIPEITEKTTNSYLNLIDEDDMHEVYKIHSLIVRSAVTAPWIKVINSPKRNYIDPLLRRFQTFSFLLPELDESLTSNLSTNLQMSFNMLTTIAATMNRGETFAIDENDVKTPEKPYDFYNSSNIDKVKQCLPTLEKLLDKIEMFLVEWPEHPTLKSIHEIIQRINKFAVTSPISRFLTGFELLLTKMREWEENAHSGVSLCEFTATLTQQIIDWRRLELNCWKDSLNTAFEKLKAKTSKWWFFLYSLVESYTTKSSINIDHTPELFSPETIQTNEIVSSEKLIELLDIFMSESSLVEYQARLDLLLTFHCHVFHLEMSTERNELLAIFWNMYNYYSRFVSDVEKKIDSIKAPIEKKLREFVKIARWNDINYWSVKETVEKTHRTLLKFIREYESDLKQKAGTYLLIKPSSYTAEANKGEWDCSKDRDYSINPQDFVISEKELKEINVPFIEKNDLISRLNKNVTTATNLCTKTILMSSYPSLRIELEHLIEDFTNHSIKLKNMDIDRTLPKPKQKTHAKSILQLKKRALADYFKTLTSIGVSYRRGVQAWQSRKSEVLNMKIMPLDISTTIQKLDNLNKADKQMLAQWDGCDSYYYKSYIKLQALHSAMAKVQTDLGPQNVERCRGFSTHIMLLAHGQKQLLANSFTDYIHLRKQITDLSNIDDGNVSLPCHEDIDACADLLRKLLTCLLTGLEQLELYLQACPEDNGDDVEEKSIVLESSNSPMINAHKGDPVWQSANTLIKDAIKSVNLIFQEHDKIFGNTSVPLIRTSIHFDSLKSSRENVVKVTTMIENFAAMFGRGTENSHPILETIGFLLKQTNRWVDQFDLIKVFDSGPTPQYDSDLKDLSTSMKNIVETILLVIQKKYKEAEAQNEIVHDEEENKEENLGDETEDVEIPKLEENGFRQKLIDALNKDITQLQLGEINNMLEGVLKMTQALDPLSASFYNSLLLKCLPILKQYLLFIQFYLNEQVAAFRTTCKLLYIQLNVFLDLATNGFCIPKDLDLEDGEADPDGTEQSKDQGGMGLGDGEGKKDVSDRIESEDQLEDARPADEEKKDEDKDCKEEDGGIDMSENFDGKMQDIEDNTDDENDEKSDDEDNKDLDKEMGDTEKGADQLDKEIWGDDEDEDETEEQNENTDEQGKGEQIGEKELSAKDDSKNSNDDKNEDKENCDEADEEQKKEINEMTEPDVNDDQINPYHGKHDPQPEPEPMDLPEDLNLDGDDEGKEDNGEGEENPFDIDEMKEAMPPPEKDEINGDDLEKEKDENADDNMNEDSSDEEGDGPTTEDTQMKDLDDDGENNGEEPDASNQQVAEPQTEEEEKKSDENKTDEQEKVGPSTDDPSKEMDSAEQSDCKADGSRDKVANQPKQEERQEISGEENSQEDGDDKGTGQAQSEEQTEGHVGSAMRKNTSVQQKTHDESTLEKRKNPGESDENRALVDNKQPDKKKQKIHNREELTEADEENSEAPEQGEDGDVDMCQHVKDSEKYDSHAIDAATEEQLKTQRIANSDDEDVTKDEDEEKMDIDMQQDEENVDEEEVKPINSEAIPKVDKDEEKLKSKSKSTNNVEDNANMEKKVDVEGENVETIGVARASESAFYTNINDDVITSLTQIERKRLEVEQMLSQWFYVPSTVEALAAWNCLSAVTEGPARDLSEKLRLVLEPTQATRLKGDYRTGKRINMRKIIPYIASQFRKDKIWLRRTKPSKRDYQIILALDDSSSMADNHSKELAFESLSLISKAMGYLEVGQLGVISFGESPKILHPLGEPFTEQSGSRLIQEMRFDQKKTMVGQLVDFTVDMFESQQSSTDNAKLLVVLSDGRGIFSEGDYVNRAVRRAKLANIFLVFIIVENPQNKDSILDIRMPVFDNGKLLEIRPYMDSFPFPFYMILRDINALPGVLSDALRQWFEVVGKLDT